MIESWINTNTQQSTHEEKRITPGKMVIVKKEPSEKTPSCSIPSARLGRRWLGSFIVIPRRAATLSSCAHPKILWRARLSKRRSSFFFHIYLAFGHDLYHFQVFSLIIGLYYVCAGSWCASEAILHEFAMTLFKHQLHFVRDRKSARCFREYLYEGFI